MLDAEHALLTAVRDAIRTATGLNDRAVRIEIDEEAPAVAGDKFVAVMSDGVAPGASHDTNSGASDLIYSVAVMVAIRHTKPRDRARDIGWSISGALSEFITQINDAVDFVYSVQTAANTFLSSQYSDTAGFVEPLRFAGIDARPRIAPAELFAAGGELRAAVVRTIRYTGARRIVTR